MCVAAVVLGTSPTLGELQDMEAENPHGGGLAWKEPGDNRVTYRKGLTAEDIHKVLDTLPRPVLLHFRWASAGSKGLHLTHPFPLGYEALFNTALEGRTKAVMIHNGTWREWRKHVPEWAKTWDISDTALAAYYLKANPQLAGQIRWAVAVGYAKGRDKPMKVSRYGDTWVKHGDNMYSNMQWVDSIADAKAAEEAKFKWAKTWTGFVRPQETPSSPANQDWWRRTFMQDDDVDEFVEARKRREAVAQGYAAMRAQPPSPDLMNLGRGPAPEPGKETFMDRLADEDEARHNANMALIEEFSMTPEEAFWYFSGAVNGSFWTMRIMQMADANARQN